MILGTRLAIRVAALLPCCMAAFAFQSAQGPIEIIPRARPAVVEPNASAQPVMRIDSSLVLIPVHVTTAAGTSVTSLRKEDFELFEDGVRQPITHFSKDDAPISAGILLDISSSMKNKMAKAAEAATEFFKSANPEDEFFLVEFNGRAKLKVPFTREWSQITDEIAGVRPSGLTAMLDGIHLAATQMKRARNARRALIVISDGGDNFSRRSFRQLRDSLLEADVQVYAMGVFDKDYKLRHSPEERNGPMLLDQVAMNTGGRDFPVVTLEELPNIGRQIARELRNQYILGFAPATAVSDGKFHKVALKITELELRAYYRQGYFSPGAAAPVVPGR